MSQEVLKGNKAIAEYLGVQQTTFIRHRDLDGIPYYRVGSDVLARKSALDEWMANGGSRKAEEAV